MIGSQEMANLNLGVRDAIGKGVANVAHVSLAVLIPNVLRVPMRMI